MTARRGLAVVETHPIQYHAPVYRMLATRFGVPVTVIYGSDFSVTGYRDPEFDATFAWDTDLLGGYTSVFLSRVARGGARSPGEVSPRGIRRALREARPDAVLLVGYSPRFHQVAFQRAWSAGFPILFRGETTDDGARSRVKTWVRDRGLRWFYRRCARLLYVGRRSCEHFRRLGCRDAALVFSPYCVDTCTFEWDESARARLRERGRRALGLTGDHILILFSGKLSPRKGPELILRAARALPEDIRPRLAVAYLGDGELRAALEREGQSAALASVRFLGFQNQRQLSPYYHAADLLVLPSLYSEPWGLVVNEALQHGLPCVVSDAVGCGPDLIEDGVTGAVFERGSSRSLASAMLRSFALIGRADARARCREQVEAYGVEKAAEGIAVAYEAVVGGGPRPDPAALTRRWHSRLPPSKTRGCVDAGRALS